MKRIALLVGNDDYSNPREHLDCAVNDATALSESLESLDFKTRLLTNVTGSELSDGLVEYVRELGTYDVGLFFFAGHGFQVKGENYLGCTDTQFEDEITITHTGYKLQDIIEDLENSELKIKILIIDACRSYASGARGLNGTFAPILAPKGTIIAFATSPRQTAKEDAKSGHGYFTKALLKHIKAKNISIEDMFKRVRNTVYVETSGRQITWEHTSLLGDFSFNDFEGKTPVIPYSELALADNEYEPVNRGICYELIQLAIKHDWNFQNMIPEKIERNIAKFKNEAPDDVFVLGRNLYQSSNDPYNMMNYFENLQTNLAKFPQEVACHLLSGMAYEIFFSCDGKLRKVFKTHLHYKNVLSTLKDQEYKVSYDFLYGQLEQYR